MGDPSRFHRFAEAIAARFTLDNDVADVAGGKGYLQLALRDRGFRRVTTWDRRNRRASGYLKYRYDLFNATHAPRGSTLVVGMHPDEGTDHIIAYAAKHRVPFCICPCCIKPSYQAFWGAHKFSAWVDHLIVLAETARFDVETFNLRISGRSLVIVGRPQLRGAA